MKDYTIKGAPTGRFMIFQDVLAHRGSPAWQEREQLYETCLAWEVNPFVALAFFVNESAAGTVGVARETRNWGNLRVGAGAYRHDQGFAWYAAWAIGLNDYCKLLRGPLYEGSGRVTVSQVVPRYAPVKDHNTPAVYIATVNGLVEVWEAMRDG